MMSTRCYPLYVKGNPQLRVFLPNFWMKLVKPDLPLPPNQVKFIVSTEMTKFDIKNYLEKIYSVPVKEVRTYIKMGKFRRSEDQRHYIVKDDDYKVAHVLLPENYTFQFPNLFPETKEDENAKEITDQALDQYKIRKEKNWQKPGIPLWFGS